MSEQQLDINDMLPSDKFEIIISKKDLDLIFKFLSRAELKGIEVPEFNRILEIFNPKILKKL
jgi:hypothetical protein